MLLVAHVGALVGLAHLCPAAGISGGVGPVQLAAVLCWDFFSRCQNILFVWGLSSSVLLPPSLWFLLDLWCVSRIYVSCLLFRVAFPQRRFRLFKMLGCFQLFRPSLLMSAVCLLFVS